MSNNKVKLALLKTIKRAVLSFENLNRGRITINKKIIEIIERKIEKILIKFKKNCKFWAVIISIFRRKICLDK